MTAAEDSDRPCGICAIIARIRAGSFEDLVAELPRSWMLLGDAQYYRGYCVLVAKRHVSELYLMPRGEVHELLDEILAASRSINQVVSPLKLNYECLGNQEPHVHWHIFPRSSRDPMRLQPVWVRAETERKVQLEDSERRSLIADLRAALQRYLPAARWIPGGKTGR
jgi:diadenosine tetraphosphate (Ap4A) HIT family hydrolase